MENLPNVLYKHLSNLRIDLKAIIYSDLTDELKKDYDLLETKVLLENNFEFVKQVFKEEYSYILCSVNKTVELKDSKITIPEHIRDFLKNCYLKSCQVYSSPIN